MLFNCILQYTSRICLALLISALNPGCAPSAEKEPLPEPSDRVISFSGYDWIVRSSNDAPEGPGPNVFSDSEENVWVDAQGRLHLKILEQGGFWYCSGVVLKHSLSYGTYIFHVASDVTQLDQHVVGGLFTHMNDTQEIDIEFSRWSDPENQNAQFAVQPSSDPENKHRFNLNPDTEKSTHGFNWQPDYIDFFSMQGHHTELPGDGLISHWKYTGGNVPPDNQERLKINLWLFRGQAPSDGKPQEMIIEKVVYMP